MCIYNAIIQILFSTNITLFAFAYLNKIRAIEGFRLFSALFPKKKYILIIILVSNKN